MAIQQLHTATLSSGTASCEHTAAVLLDAGRCTANKRTAAVSFASVKTPLASKAAFVGAKIVRSAVWLFSQPA